MRELKLLNHKRYLAWLKEIEERDCKINRVTFRRSWRFMTLDQFHKAHSEERKKTMTLEQKNERDRLFYLLAVGRELNTLRKEMIAQKYTLWHELPWLRSHSFI